MSTVPLRADEAQPTGFWQRPFVQDILPFLTSMVLHLGLIALGLLTYKTIQIVIAPTSKEVNIVPELGFSNTEIMPRVFSGPEDGDPLRQYMRDDVDYSPDARGYGTKASEQITALVSGSGGGETGDPLIAVGIEKGGFAKNGQGGFGAGDGRDLGTGGDAGLAPRGLPGGGSNVFPPERGGNATRIVFLCDSSGSMMNKIDTLRAELRKAIDQLKPIQGFDVVFFAQDNYLAMDKQLMLALPETKRKAYDFLDGVSPHGSSSPLPGLRAAFATGPQLLFILTDGDFPNNSEVLTEVRRLNAEKKVKINTIAFFDRGEEYEKLLKQIADENGGLFRFVSESDLQK